MDLAEKRKLLYRSLYRGCKETDIILGEFAKSCLFYLSPEELEQYQAIVAMDDEIIYEYCKGGKPLSSAYPLFKRIIEHQAAKFREASS